jgi:hypothetical protein
MVALIDALVMCMSVFVDLTVVPCGSTARVDSAGWPACELCGTRLNRVKHHRPSGVGRKCDPRCKGTKRQSEERTSSTERPVKIPRRTKSDPGQPMHIASTRLRVRAPKPPPPATKPRNMKPSIDSVDPMALLEAAHARRLALLQQESTLGLSFGGDS